AAGKMMGIGGESAPRIGDADLVEELGGACQGYPVAHPLMEGDRLGNLVADPMHGIERGHRLLKDHRDLIAAHGAHAIEIERQEVASLTVSTSEEHAAG